ncbi:MAG TPA: DUF3368 domain-containing protein [Ktedonobacterales bacterium]|nr:DUF3368 domain-containing protein [Ktedonobacterales bacterium]
MSNPSLQSAPRPVVSNTTPLISLAGVKLLHLLPAIYGEIWIPSAVYNEYQVGRTSHPDSPDLDTLPWLRVHHVGFHPDVPTSLDAGEAAAISLALSSAARLALLDETRARRIAARLGLPIAGSLTVLIEAKRRGHIPLVTPIVDQMIAQGRRISDRLRMTVLQLAGE